MANLVRYFVLLGLLGGLLAGCELEENFVTGDAVEISFSTDTLRFDTVFVEQGSATRSFRVYNRSNEPVQIDRIFVNGRSDVDFRINVDGTTGPSVEDVIIWDNDSIHVFVEVTIDPTQPEEVSPFVVEDQVVFQTGDTRRQVQLEAFGQNAIYFPSRFNRGVPVVLSCDNSTLRWDSELPYVIYGEVFIDSCLLEIAAGTRIYVHGGIARNEPFGVFNDGFLYTLPRGRIHVNGTLEEPVEFSTDRLEAPFQDEAGQWTGIVLGPLSRGNRFSHAVIRNSIFGLLVDSLAEVELDHSIIAYTASSAITGRRGSIKATNCLFHSNFANAVQLIQGGDLEMDHCTVANYGVDASALALQNFQCFDAACQSFAVYRIRADLRNCIFTGSRNDEIILSDASERADASLFRLNMENCIVRVQELLTGQDGLYANFFETYCKGCIDAERNDPLFVDRDEDNYQLDSLSIAIDRGILLPDINDDLKGRPRDDQPDIGSYERQQ